MSSHREASAEKPSGIMSPSVASFATAPAAPVRPLSQLQTDPSTGLSELLENLKNKFSATSEDMLAKMDEMSKRLDNLESQLRIDNSQTENKS